MGHIIDKGFAQALAAQILRADRQALHLKLRVSRHGFGKIGLKTQLAAPDEDFTRLVGKKIYDGMLTKAVMEQLRPSIRAAFDEVIRDRIQASLNITLRGAGAIDPAPVAEVEPEDSPGTKEVETTPEEVEGFMIVRAIPARVADIERITLRDAKSYCAILMDDNNRRPVCRLYFNSPTNRSIGIFAADKSEARHKITRPSDIYQFAPLLEAVVSSYSG